MRARHILLAVALVGGLAGCGSSGEDKPAAAPTTPSKQLSAEDIAKAEEAAGIPPKPDQATADAYLAALGNIDAEILESTKPDRLISRGRDQCTSIKEWPDDQAKLITFVNTRFSSPDHPNGFGTTKAKKINDVVHKYICPSY